MKIAVLSGKGGTGKTTFSSSFAFITKSLLIDTDIEEPNSHIFLKGKTSQEVSIFNHFPKVDMEKCTLCGKCGDFCRFNAIIPAKNRVVIFGESCHDCGGCQLVCPTNAISWEKREIGKIFVEKSYFNSDLLYGKLNIGEMSGVKIIKGLHSMAKGEDIIIDCPPGTSCNTVNALEGSDFAILVTEPSPFGLSDMKLVVQLLQDMEIPFGIVINKADNENSEILDFCYKNSIEILGELPFSREVAKSYSEGKIIADALPDSQEIFKNILKKVKEYGN